jgi:hypothetical protein
MDFDAYFDASDKTVEVYRHKSSSLVTSFKARDEQDAKSILRKRGFKVKDSEPYTYGTAFHGSSR